MSAAAPAAKCPRSANPSNRAGAARVIVAISAQVYSRVIAAQRRHRHRLLRQCLDPLRAQVALHQQRQQVGIGGERRTVRMVGGEEHAPGIIDQQEQLQARCPLHRVGEAAAAIAERHDAAAIAVTVHDRGLARMPAVARVELAQHVARDRHRLAEHHLPDIRGDVRGRIHRLGQPGRRRREAARAVCAVSVELQMRQMQRSCPRRRRWWRARSPHCRAGQGWRSAGAADGRSRPLARRAAALRSPCAR